jgi:hypothetical protein
MKATTKTCQLCIPSQRHVTLYERLALPVKAYKKKGLIPARTKYERLALPVNQHPRQLPVSYIF